MADSKDDERDEEWFKEVYGKEYKGPVRPGSDNARDNPSTKKRSLTEAIQNEPDEDEAPPDPNAVPTDFTSRQAKVWEAKAKAIERNWKKKKEEELTCRICGEYGHFSQGCPSTLGVNRRQSEVVEKIPVKDRRLKPKIIGTGGSTVQGIEKDTGCRLKLEDNLGAGNGSFFVRISGSNRAMVGKAVDAVKRLLDDAHDDRKPQNARKSHDSHNRSSDSLAREAHMQHIASQQTLYEPNLQPFAGQEGSYYDEQHNSMDQLGARRQWESGSQTGAFMMAPYGLKGGPQYDERPLSKGVSKEDDHVRDVVEVGFDQPRTLEGLEQKFAQETMQLTKDLNDAEDKENARHRQAIREIEEQYQQKMASLRAAQGKRRDEFLRQEAHFRQQQYQQYQQPQGGSKYYTYDMGGPLASGFSNGPPREQPGYGGPGSGDRNDGPGDGYGSFRGGGYHSSSHSYRSSAYDSGMMHSGNQGYDAGPYRY